MEKVRDENEELLAQFFSTVLSKRPKETFENVR